MLTQIESTHRGWLERGLLIVAGLLLLISLLFPYWRVDLKAGVYPKGLTLQLRPYGLEGDVEEIDKLNHYIGMRKLESAGQLERKIAIPSIVIAALCLLTAAFVPRKWSMWFTLPGLIFPGIFLGELYWWLADSGLNLDPDAPLNQSIKPFIPPIFGEGRIAQFGANASFQLGFLFAVLAALLSRLAFYLKKPEWLAKGLIIDASVLLLISLLFPYWRVDFEARKFPKGLILQVRPHRLEGNIREVDKLNRDVGMREIEAVGQFERKVAVPSIVIAALCLLTSVFVPRKWSMWFALPGLIFPIIFVGELYWWLRQSGLNLDSEIALYPDIEPFIPPVIGTETVKSVTTTSTLQIGFYLTILTTLLSGVALFLKTWGWIPLRKPITAIVLIIFALSMPLTSMAETLIVDENSSIGDTLKLAADGDTIVVKGGVHHERFVVDKSVTFIGENEPTIDGGGEGSIITINAPAVVVRGFTIRNTGDRLSEGDAGIMIKKAKGTIVEESRFVDVLFGVQVRNAPDTLVRNNMFHGKDLDVARRGDLIRVWYSSGAVVENNSVSDGRDVVIWYSKNVTVRGNEVRNGRYGIHFMYCDDATIEENRLIGNSVGIYLMYSYRLRLQRNWSIGNRGASGYGIGQKDMHDGLIVDNFVADNRAGMFMDNSTNTFRGNLIAFNDFGLLVFPSARKNTFAENSLVDNGEQVAIEGQGSLGTNRWVGNYWSDYSGYDADGDGIGDMPYRSVHLFERLTERYSALRLFTYSPSAQALDFASRLFPVFAPQPKLTDSSPRMRPVVPPLEAPIRHLSSAWLLGSTALFLSALILSGRLGKWTNLLRFRDLRLTHHVSPDTQSASAISIRNVTKRFGKAIAVDDLSFEIVAGETIALWGPNGAGKTTALRCLLGILPFKGTIEVCGRSARTAGKAVRRQIGYVPQEVRLHSDLTVRETICFYARLRSISADRVETLMTEWQLSEIADKWIGDLSGGMKQRLALAIALLSDPPILLLDEPTSNLDVQTRHEFWGALERLKNRGKTLIFCSHRVDEIFRLADRVIVMEDGKKIAEGAPASLNGHLQCDAQLHLTIPKSLHTAATSLLEQHGFSPQRNSTRISVQASQDKKVEPFRVLMEASIPILDFELSNEQERSD
jgi:nitrous oxidase accessory protein